jgi:hypothetical protein
MPNAGIECSFRDTKDPHFGMGMGQIRINSPERRDRLWLLNALAAALLTLLGAAGEALGFDKHLKASTTKRRAHHATAAAGSLARVVLQLARFLGVGAINPMRAAYACFSIGIAGVSYGQELKGRCAKKPL